MIRTWILAAESSRAVIYAVESRLKPLREVDALTHPEGRGLTQDFTSDRPGRAFDTTGLGGRHAMGKEVDPKRQEALSFAKRLAERVDRGRTRGDFDELVLIAPPTFLGLLREKLNGQTLKLVRQSVGKNLVQAGEQAIRLQLFG